MKRSVKVRFHLLAGPNFGKWQIKYDNGDIMYVDPETSQLSMFDCKLKVRPAAAKKIFEGNEKMVCAWVECDWLRIANVYEQKDRSHISFNPRKSKHWLCQGEVMDNKLVGDLFSVNRSLFLI